MALTTAPGDNRMQQFLYVDPIGFHAAGATIDLQGCRIHNPTLDAVLLEQTRQPEAVVACFIAKHQLWLLLRFLGPTLPGGVEFGYQANAVATWKGMQARIIPVWQLDR